VFRLRGLIDLLNKVYIININNMNSDYTFDDLIEAGIVKNEKGECYAIYNGEQSITHCIGVKSERGLYRVWISNLQKMIRRGKLNEAITSMIECVESGDVFKSNVINRLAKVIVSEDIGLANPLLPIYCSKVVKKYDKRELTNNDILQLVYILVKSKKSRLLDDLYHDCNKTYNLTFEKSFELLKEAIKNKDLLLIVGYLNSCIETSKGIKKTITIKDIKKRQQIYEVWKYILELSGFETIIYKVNYALLELYISQENNGGRKLNIIQAISNIILKEKLEFEKEEPRIDLVWKRDENIWPWSVSYDLHSIPNAIKLNRGIDFFFKYGAYLENEKKISC